MFVHQLDTLQHALQHSLHYKLQHTLQYTCTIPGHQQDTLQDTMQEPLQRKLRHTLLHIQYLAIGAGKGLVIREGMVKQLPQDDGEREHIHLYIDVCVSLWVCVWRVCAHTLVCVCVVCVCERLNDDGE